MTLSQVLGSLLLSVKEQDLVLSTRERIDGRQGRLSRPMIWLGAKGELDELCLRYTHCDSMMMQDIQYVTFGVVVEQELGNSMR